MSTQLITERVATRRRSLRAVCGVIVAGIDRRARGLPHARASAIARSRFPLTATAEHFDALVVGSGFGGSVTAYRLVGDRCGSCGHHG